MSKSKQGWISLNRELMDHWIWDDGHELTRAEAWIYLLMNARHDSEPKKVSIKDKVFMCHRGQSLRSLDTMARDWNWNRSKVRRFLKKLESESMIRYENETVTIRITICNYDTYQSQSVKSETNLKRKRNEFETNLNTNNNDNNENKAKDEDFFFFGIDVRTLKQHRLDGKKRTLAELKHIAKLQAEGITTD